MSLSVIAKLKLKTSLTDASFAVNDTEEVMAPLKFDMVFSHSV